MKLYVCGPMTGYPRFNFPAFDEASAHLRSFGHEVTSPAELHTAEVRERCLASTDGLDHEAYAADGTWGEVLAHDVRLIVDALDAVVVLPGWARSKGARLETFVATLCGKPVRRLDGRAVRRWRMLLAWGFGR